MTAAPRQTARAVFRNVIFGFSTWILPLFLSFVATPVIVRTLGNEEYGIYALILGFIAYSFNFNVGRAITKYVAEYRAIGDLAKISEIVSATATISLLVGLFGLISISAAAGLLVDDVLRIPEPAHERSVTALYLAAATIFSVMVNQIFSAVIQGAQRFDVYAKILNVTNLLIIGGNLFLAWRGYGLNVLLLWNLIVTVATAVLSGVLAFKIMPELRFKLSFRRESIVLVLEYSRWVILYQILANLLLLFERAWITAQLGSESLTYYVVPMTLGLSIQSFMSSLMLVLFPLAAELKNDTERLRDLYLKATKIAVLLTVFIAVTLIVLSVEFLTAWMGPDFARASAGLMVAHVITFSLLGIAVVGWQMTEGLGFPNYNFFAFVSCFVVSVFAMITVTSEFGLNGIAYARLAGFSLLFLSIFLMEWRFFGTVQSSFWVSIGGKLGIAGLLGGIVEYFVIGKVASGWPGVAAAVVSGGLVYLGVALLLGILSADERELFRRVSRR